MNDRLIAAILDPSRNIISDIQRGSRYISDMNNARLDQILKGHQNTIYGEQARVAPQMADEELRGLLLKNMISKAEADIAPQKQKALLQDILAGTGLKNSQIANWNIRNQYLPQEKDEELAMARLQRELYPQKEKALIQDILAGTGLKNSQIANWNIVNQYLPNQLQAQLEHAYLTNNAKKLDNIVKKIQADYAPQMADEELRGLLLKNMISKAEADIAPQKQKALLQDILAGTGLKNSQTANLNIGNQYLPQEKDEELAMARLQRELYPQKEKALIQDILAGTGLKNSQTANLNIGNQYLPQEKDEALAIARLQRELYPQKEKALIQDILAGTGLKNSQTANLNIGNQYLPQEKDEALATARLQRELYPQHMENERLKSQAYGNANSPWAVSMRHSSPEARRQQEIDYIQETGRNPANPNQVLSKEDQDKLILTNRFLQDKNLISPQDEKFFGNSVMMLRTYQSTLEPFKEFADYFNGVKGKILLASDKAKAAKGEFVPRYQKFQEFLKVASSALAETWRNSVGAATSKNSMNKFYNAINPDFWFNNPEMAFKTYLGLGETFMTELESRTAKLPKTSATREFMSGLVNETKQSMAKQSLGYTEEELEAELKKREAMGKR